MKLPVIVGLDALGGDRDRAEELARSLCGRVAGYKVGYPNILPCTGVGEAVRRACPGALIVADLKLADIGYTMKHIASHVIDWSDAAIAHSFIGVEGALDELKEYLDSNGKRLVLVASMSHPGAGRIIDPILDKIVEVVGEIGPWGIVAPATRPNVVRILRERFPGKVILSPGVGAQGASPGDALRAGADYEIIGRMITASKNPLLVVESLEERYRMVLGD